MEPSGLHGIRAKRGGAHEHGAPPFHPGDRVDFIQRAPTKAQKRRASTDYRRNGEVVWCRWQQRSQRYLGYGWHVSVRWPSQPKKGCDPAQIGCSDVGRYLATNLVMRDANWKTWPAEWQEPDPSWRADNV